MSDNSLSCPLTWNLNYEKKVYGGRGQLLPFILETIKPSINQSNKQPSIMRTTLLLVMSIGRVVSEKENIFKKF